jgi:hypothetical protein
MILFLDFDGTTHPFGCHSKDDFSCLPRIEKVLREFPQIQIVISSNWRYSATLDQLRPYFSEDIRPRVIGVTPLDDETKEYGHGTLLVVPAKTRHGDIMAWIARNDYQGTWLALDDDTRGFPDECWQLIRCDSSVGVDAAIEEEFRFSCTMMTP